MRCDTCKHWTELQISKDHNFNPKTGLCEGLHDQEKVTIEVNAGWDANAVLSYYLR